MKPGEILLPAALLIAPACLLGEDVAPVKSRTSARISQEIRFFLPAYDSSKAATESKNPSPVGTPGTDQPPTPDILQLPKMTVRERQQQRLDPDQMISRSDLLKKQKRQYLESLEREGGLTRLLNSFSIPLVSPSVASRARNYYEAQKMQQLAGTVSAIGEVDPDAAKELRKELFKAVDRPSLGKK